MRRYFEWRYLCVLTSFYSAVSRQYTILLDMLFKTHAYHNTQKVFCYQNAIHLLDVAFRAQDDVDRDFTLRHIYSQVTENRIFSTSPIGPQYLLFFLMASYVGLSLGTNPHLTAFGYQREESLILWLGKIRNRIHFSQITQTVDPSQWGPGFKIFVEQVELKMTRVVNQACQPARMVQSSETSQSTQEHYTASHSYSSSTTLTSDIKGESGYSIQFYRQQMARVDGSK